MSIVFFSPGILADFTSSSGTSAEVPGWGNNKGNHPYSIFATLSGTEGALVKTVPSAAEYWAQTYIQFTDLVGAPQDMLIGFYNGSTRLARVAVTTGSVLSATIDASTVVAATAANAFIYRNISHTVEVHYKRHATAGIFKVWVDGVLLIDFAGNTGAQANIDAVRFGPYRTTNLYTRYSDFIIDNAAQIGDRQVICLEAKTNGATTSWTPSDLHFGHTQGYTAASSAAAQTFVLSNPCRVSGAVKKIIVTGKTAGNIKVFRATAGGTPAQFSAAGAITLPITAAVCTFVDGIDFNGFDVTAGEFLGFYTDATATLGRAVSASSATWHWYKAGDYSAAANTAYTYTLAGFAIEAYVENTDGVKTVDGPADAWWRDLDWLETNTEDAISLVTMQEVPAFKAQEISAIAIGARVKSEGTPTPTKARIVTRRGTTIYNGGENILSTAFANYREVQTQDPSTSAAWTVANLNAAQFGVKAIT